MKITTIAITCLLPQLVIAETFQRQFASESNMCARLSQGLGLTATTNRLDLSTWTTPANLVFGDADWDVEEVGVEEYDNCRLVSLSCHVGTTNVTAEVRLCEDPETALFATMFHEVAFRSISPFRLLPTYVLERDGANGHVLYRKKDSGGELLEEPDYGNLDCLFGNASVYVQGPLDLRDFPAALLRAGGVEVPGDEVEEAPPAP